jgi:geranylgeranyl pyrophosphate synthase
MNNLEEFKKYYSEEKESLEKLINDFNKDLENSSKNRIIKENLHLFANLNSNGKLIRGTLVNLGYNLLNEDKTYANYLGLAYEIFQTAILVHDDIIDNDSKRRGKDTIQYATINKYKKYDLNKQELANIGNSVGICMGDYGLYLSNKVLIDNYKDDKNFGKVFSYFNDTVINTIKGEILDVVLPYESKHSINTDNLEDNIMEIYKYKTAYYTIIGPLLSGMILAGADESKLNDIQKFGEKIGIAFQIQDDILGIYSKETGKVIGSDIREFKQTILYSYINNTKYNQDLMKYYGCEDLTEDKIEKVRELFDISGARNHANHLMNQMYNEGLAILNKITWLDDKNRSLLIGFVEQLRTRKR